MIAHGPVVHAKLDPKDAATVALTIDQMVKPLKFPTTEKIKLVELPSAKLSAFYHRPIKHRAAVILPSEIAEAAHPDQGAGQLYIIPGFRRRSA